MTKGGFDDYDGTRSIIELEDGTKALKLAFDKALANAPSDRKLTTIENYDFKFQIPAAYRPYLNSVKLTMENRSNVFTSWEPIINGEEKEVKYPYYLLAFTDGTIYSKISDKTLQIDAVDYEYTLPAVGVAKVNEAGYVGYADPNTADKWTEADKSGMTEVVLSVTVPYIENLDTYVMIKDITLTLEGLDYIFGAGNDSTENDNILRTFDIATYNVEFKTALRQAAIDDNIQGYKKGRLYFEFILPLSENEGRFETDSMAWLQANSEIKYESTVLEDGRQILRGSYMLLGNDDNKAAIGASEHTLSIVVRALRLHDDDTFRPSFTFWLEYNKVAENMQYSEDGKIPETVVTGSGYVCSEHSAKENSTVICPEMTISAAPRYNVAVFPGYQAFDSAVGSYDFSTGSDNAPNKDVGSIYGRLNGYAVIIEIRGKTGYGLKGVEIPDQNTPITFDLQVSSEYIANGKIYNDTESLYRPLLWDRRGNNDGDWNYSREAQATAYGHVRQAPANKGTGRTACEDGGAWSFVQDNGDSGLIHVTVSDFVIGTHYPSGNQTNSEQDAVYYNPLVINDSNYWEADRAIFSCGEFWLFQPYYSLDSNRTYIMEQIPDSDTGQFNTTVIDTGFTMKSSSGTVVDNSMQAITEDDVNNDGRVLTAQGGFFANLSYLKGGSTRWDDFLSGTLDEDKDWAVLGQAVTLEGWITNDGGEGIYQTVAADYLLKFDDEFFEPSGSYNLVDACDNFDKKTVLWAAKADGTGWQSDEEMKSTTQSDLVFYASLGDLKADGKTPVGVLVELRGLSTQTKNHMHFFIHGNVKKDCPVNKAYMMTHTAYLWTKSDIKDMVLEASNKTSDNDLTDNDYKNYSINNIPSAASKKLLDANHNYTGDYPTPSFRRDCYDSDSYSQDLKNAKAASYDATGYIPGYGAGVYQDTCLVIEYITTVSKSTAQKEQSTGASKIIYDMSQNQRTVDYIITPKIDRTCGVGASVADKLNVTLYLKDTLPKGLTYIQGSSYLGGSYEQDTLAQKPGTVTGGINCEPTIETDSEGNTTLTWSITAENVDVNTVWSGNLYFSCSIGTPGDENNDVKDGDQLNNNITVWSDGEQKRPFTKENGNLAEYGIQIMKNSVLSLSKLADSLVVEKGDDIGFTMNVGNNSATAKLGTVIAETLPYNDINGTSFSGALKVKEFSAALVNEGVSSPVSDGNFAFYYSTDASLAGNLATYYQTKLSGCSTIDEKKNYFSANGWTQLTFSETPSTVKGMNLYSVTNDLSVESGQITAIVAVGNLYANQTMKMHITFNLQDGKGKDCLVNYLSQDTLVSYARTYIVSLISSRIASPANRGNDDSIDSDGIAVYSEDRATLLNTSISEIVMKPASELTYGTDESKYHDSGFYDRGYELPKSGGSGTTGFYTTGALLCGTVILSFVYIQSQRKLRAKG